MRECLDRRNALHRAIRSAQFEDQRKEKLSKKNHKEQKK